MRSNLCAFGIYNNSVSHAHDLTIAGETTELVSTLSQAGRSRVCDNELVTYQCRTNGGRLEWTSPQSFGDNEDSIIFISSNTPGQSSNVRNREIWALLISVTPSFESILTINTASDRCVSIECFLWN